MRTFQQRVDQILQNEYKITLTEEFKDKHNIELQESEDHFNQLLTIDKNHERYRLDWAFEESTDIFKAHVKRSREKMEIKIPEYTEEYNNVREEVLDQIGNSTRLYSIFSMIVSILDIVISVFLILIVTMLASAFEQMIESIIFTIFFVLVVASFKVVLDRFFVIPKIDQWGWRRFHQITDEIIEIASTTVAMRIVIITKYNTNQDLDEITEFCKSEFDTIKTTYFSSIWHKEVY